MPKVSKRKCVPARRAIAISTYNRAKHLGEVIEGVLSTMPNSSSVFVVDDGSTDDTPLLVTKTFPTVTYYRGPNLGVGANKTRCLYLMKNSHFSCILEDDLVPVSNFWFETYETAATLMDVHHFCRVQDKEIPETMPGFTEYLQATMKATPIYASSPRGDFTFLTRRVITTVGGMNPHFKGVGYAHGEWSDRVVKAGLVSHPLSWIDIREARDKFKQVGDTEGGRWDADPSEVKKQLDYNKRVARALRKEGNLYCPLQLR